MHVRLLRRSLPVVAALSLLAALPAGAQFVTLPQPSPAATVTQTVGITEISVEYNRPSVNGRTIWGGLVPYDAVWRAGANENTTITFSHPVEVGGQPLAAGTYGLHVFPHQNGPWEVAFSDAASAWGSFSYDESEDATRIEVAPEAAPHREQLAYSFDEVAKNDATLALHWETVRLPIPIAVDTDAAVLANLGEELRGISQFFWQPWTQAANYVLANQLDAEQGLAWVESSIGVEENVTNLSLKSRLLRAAGRDGEANEVLARAEGLAASEVEVNNLGYGYLQGGDVAKAIEIFERNTREHPESWNVWDSLAEAQAAAGRTDEAVANYAKAREMAPEVQHARIDAALEQLEGE